MGASESTHAGTLLGQFMALATGLGGGISANGARISSPKQFEDEERRLARKRAARKRRRKGQRRG